MPNRNIVVFDFSAQLAYMWARSEAKKRYGGYIRKSRICNPEAFAHPAERDFEMGLFIGQNCLSTDSEKKNYAILWRRWYGGNTKETVIYEYLTNPEVLPPKLLDQYIEAGKRKFQTAISKQQ